MLYDNRKLVFDDYLRCNINKRVYSTSHKDHPSIISMILIRKINQPKYIVHHYLHNRTIHVYLRGLYIFSMEY